MDITPHLSKAGSSSLTLPEFLKVSRCGSQIPQILGRACYRPAQLQICSVTSDKPVLASAPHFPFPNSDEVRS